MKMNQFKNRKGFSLIEMIVAITLAAVTFLAIYNLNSSNISNSASSRDQSQATRLVQEGLEAVRSIRSNNAAVVTFGGVARNWNNFVAAVPADSNPQPAEYGFILSYSPSGWTMAEPTGSPNFAVPDNPIFWRRVMISKPTSDNGLLKVKVEVCWGKTSVEACFSPTTRQEQFRTAQTKLGPKNTFVN